MTRRSIVAVVLLSLVTLGIYAMVWLVKTKREMLASGATDIPTSWLLVVPLAHVYWMWKYAGGVEHVTAGKTSQNTAFLLLVVLGVIGFAIIQDGFNKVADRGQLPIEARALG
jgi:hypothetical protein